MSGATMSTAWMRDSGMRTDCRRMKPLSMRRSAPSMRHLVTAHDTIAPIVPSPISAAHTSTG